LFDQFPALRDFFVYFQRNYLDGNFSPQMWNVYSRTMELRTNNAVESYHNRRNRVVGVRHPSLSTFIRILKDQQSVTNVKMRAIQNLEPAPLSRRKWRRLESNINRLKERYDNGEVNINQYWRAVSHLTLEN